MATERGSWHLNVNVELSDLDREHIADAIREGFTEGEIVAGGADDEDDRARIAGDLATIRKYGG